MANIRNSVLIIIIMIWLPTILSAQKVSDLKFYNAEQFEVIGKGFEESQGPYTRLPLSIKGEVRGAVWDLGLNSAGLAIRFSTDSKCIGAKWTLLNNFSMAHMPATGIRGMDLYRLEEDEWRFVGTAQPNGKESSNIFIRRMSGEMAEYVIYLPLYDGVIDIEIGVDSTAMIGLPKNSSLTRTLQPDMKPILFYGTSITQGGCASRPGMAYPAIIGRMTGAETINLGFSGNARMDFVMAESITKIDASSYVLDCLPNCTAQIVRDSAQIFIEHILKVHPRRPVYMVEEVEFPYFEFDAQSAADHEDKNREWLSVYNELRNKGYENLYYIKSEGLLGNDGEATVDATHFTDLGFMRFARELFAGMNAVLSK